MASGYHITAPQHSMNTAVHHQLKARLLKVCISLSVTVCVSFSTVAKLLLLLPTKKTNAVDNLSCSLQYNLPVCWMAASRPSNILVSLGDGSAQICLFCLLVACLTTQQHASVSQGRICTDNFTCCRTEIEAADQTFHLTQSQYTDTGPTSPSADPITPGAWQGSHWSANF